MVIYLKLFNYEYIIDMGIIVLKYVCVILGVCIVVIGIIECRIVLLCGGFDRYYMFFFFII